MQNSQGLGKVIVQKSLYLRKQKYVQLVVNRTYKELQSLSIYGGNGVFSYTVAVGTCPGFSHVLPPPRAVAAQMARKLSQSKHHVNQTRETIWVD
jgi:hypothetical protein